MKRKVVAVSDVNRYVSHMFEEDYMLRDLWVAGEVSNCKYHHTGHIYFTLKDDKASINAVMFSKDAQKLTVKLTEGTKIVARVRIALYEKTGAYQGYVSEIEMQGMGSLYEQFEKLKAKLSEEGLFDPLFKKPIPKFPHKVGVITSRTGAAIKDILQVARRRNPNIPVYIYPSHVQGEHAKDEIVASIALANKENLVDVIILGRGGGAIEDLWVFNEEAVARAIFASKIPIVSAVGHEVDFTIADFVGDLRAPTPSAAAEIVFPSQTEYEELVKKYKNTLTYTMRSQITYSKQRLESITSRPIFANKSKLFEDWMIEVDEMSIQLHKVYQNRVKEAYGRFEDRINQLEKLSPLATLKRGYSVTTDEAGRVIKTAEDVAVGDAIAIRLSEGSIEAKVYKKG
ncbi:MAG: exodeoxyribonuclease VII large subunit [Cellulosilyticaceae bacterium]